MQARAQLAIEPTSGRVTSVRRSERILHYNGQYINDLPVTSPHGSDFGAIRKILELHRFEPSTRHSNGIPRQGLRPPRKPSTFWAMSRAREKIRAPATATIAIFLPFINSSGRIGTRPPCTVVSLTSRDGGSVRPCAKFRWARTAQNNSSIRKGCWPPPRRSAECNACAP
jgi:hypothetical protein